MDQPVEPDAGAPLQALLRQHRRSGLGLLAAASGHGLAVLGLPLTLWVCAGLASVVPDDPAAEGTAVVLASAGALALFASVALLRPLLDAGLVRALEAELDEGVPLGMGSALTYAWERPGAVILSRWLADVVLQLVSLLSLPVLVVPVRVARGEGLAEAIQGALSDLGKRPGWHALVWLLFLAVWPATILWPPLFATLPTLWAVHVDRAARGGAHPEDVGRTEASLGTVLIGLAAMAAGLETALLVVLVAVAAAGAAEGDLGTLAPAAVFAAKVAAGWVAIGVARAGLGEAGGLRRAGVILAVVAAIGIVLGVFVGCCYPWLPALVVAIAAIAVAPAPDPAGDRSG